jgi:hypothetical protein
VEGRMQKMFSLSSNESAEEVAIASVGGKFSAPSSTRILKSHCNCFFET